MIQKWLQDFNSFFGIDNKITIPVVITLLVFILTQILSGLSKYFMASRRRKVVKRILKKTLIDFSANLEREVVNSSKTANLFKSKDSLVRINKSNFSQITVFTEIGYREMFDTFYQGLFNRLNSKLRMRAISKLWGVINGVKEWEEYLQKELNIFNELNNKQINLFNTSHKKYVDYIYNLLIVGNSFKTENEKRYVMELEKIRANWQTADNHLHPDVVYDKLVKASDELNSKFTNITNHLTLPSLSILHEMDLHYRNRNNLLEVYSGLYLTTCDFYLMSLRRINIIVSILYPSKTLSIRRFFHYLGHTKTPKKRKINFQFSPESLTSQL